MVNVFKDRDSGVEYVEEKLLAHSAQVRKRWLVFKPLQVFHAQYVLRAKYEAMEELLGGHIGERVWMYTETEEVEKGALLCKAGELNDKLYLLQQGRLSSYIEVQGGERIRLHTMTRGACVNEDSLFLDMPTSQTMIADERSVVISITRDSWRRLEAEDPQVALQIQRIVMLHGATVRKTLEQEIDALERWENVSLHKTLSTKLENIKTIGIIRSPNPKRRLTRGNDKQPESFSSPYTSSRKGSLLEAGTQHHFHHLMHGMSPGATATQDIAADEERVVEDLDVHMSDSMTQLARRCYKYHLARVLGRCRDELDLLLSPDFTEEFSEDDSLRLPDYEVRRAIMDLGKFPTQEELNGVTKPLLRRRGVTHDQYVTQGASLSLFLDMVKRFDLADLSRDDVLFFYRKFRKHAHQKENDEFVITSHELGPLMLELGRAEEPLELKKMFLEWGQSSGEEGGSYIDCNNFLSMMSHFIKLEETDEKVEEIFCLFARQHKEHKRAAVSATDIIDASDIRRVMHSKGLPITVAEADEMIQDADCKETGSIDFEEFRAAILMVSEAELNAIDSQQQEKTLITPKIGASETLPEAKMIDGLVLERQGSRTRNSRTRHSPRHSPRTPYSKVANGDGFAPPSPMKLDLGTRASQADIGVNHEHVSVSQSVENADIGVNHEDVSVSQSVENGQSKPLLGASSASNLSLSPKKQYKKQYHL